MRIWLAAAPADIRCGFERLAEPAQAVTDQNPMDGHLFLFRGRNGDRLKILYWDHDDYALWYKRLEEGVFKLPRFDEKARSVELRKPCRKPQRHMTDINRAKPANGAVRKSS